MPRLSTSCFPKLRYGQVIVYKIMAELARFARFWGPVGLGIGSDLPHNGPLRFDS